MGELSDVSREYFSDLNPTAARLYRDITQFSCLLGDRWNTLPEHEKDCLIDDHIVPPDIRDRYGDHWDAQQEDQYFPRFILKSGGGVVVDTDGETWDDEHSGPFSWETSSQNELSLDELLTDKPRQHLKDPKRCKSPSRGGGVGGGSGAAASGANAARTRTSAVLFDSSPIGGGTDFDHLRSMWEQGNVTGTAADDGGAGSAADAVDGQPRASGPNAATPSAADSNKEFSAAASGRAAASASGTLPAAPNRFPATLPRQSDPRRVGTLPGKAAAGKAAAGAAVVAVAGTTIMPDSGTTAATVTRTAITAAVTAASEVAAASSTASATVDVAAAAGGRGSVTSAAANINDDPVFQQHRVTFGSARPPAAASRGGRARPRSGGLKAGTTETAGFSADGAGEAVKTGFDFLDDW